MSYMHNEIIFRDFESAKKARKMVYEMLKEVSNKEYRFVSIGDLVMLLFGDPTIDWKKIQLTKKKYADEQFAWKKKGNLAIYEYECSGQIWYVFEDPVKVA